MTQTGKTHPCAYCRNRFDLDSSEAFPFCSERCRKLDLSRWLGEEYRLPMPVTERNIDELVRKLAEAEAEAEDE